MIVGMHPQHFHGDVLEGQQQLGAIGQQQIDVRAGKLHHDVGGLEFVPGGVHVLNRIVHLEAAIIEGGSQDGVDFRTDRRGGVFSLCHWVYFLPFFFLGGSTERAASIAA